MPPMTPMPSTRFELRRLRGNPRCRTYLRACANCRHIKTPEGGIGGIGGPWVGTRPSGFFRLSRAASVGRSPAPVQPHGGVAARPLRIVGRASRTAGAAPPPLPVGLLCPAPQAPASARAAVPTGPTKNSAYCIGRA